MKQQITEQEMVQLIKESGFSNPISFTFGPSGVSVIDKEDELQAIRDDKELQAVRDFNINS